MNLAKLPSTTAFRLAASFAALFSSAVLIVFAFLYLAMGQALEARLERRVIARIAQLQTSTRGEDHVEDGTEDNETSDGHGLLEHLAQSVRDAAEVHSDHPDIILLTDAAGGFVAGNIQSAPKFDGWRRLTHADLVVRGTWPHDDIHVLGRWTVVKHGNLFVGGDTEDIEETQHLLLMGLLWSLGLTTLLALTAGVLLGLRAQGRIDAMGTALSAVAKGDLTRRVILRRSRDDLDGVARQINAALDRLQVLFESVQQSAADIAHELRTPLGRLRQRLDTARSRAQNTSDYAAAIDASLGDIDSIADTFEALLSINQIESGSARAAFVEVDLAAIAETVFEAYGAVAEDQGQLLVRVLPAGGTARILGNTALLTRMLANLVENAIRHCPRGAQIAIELTGNAAGALILTVRDTGPGIPAAERERVLDRFYRLEKSRSTPGSGLGLAIVAAIARLHEARIALGDNQPGLVVSIQFAATTQAG